MTLDMVHKHGIANVRGSMFCQVEPAEVETRWFEKLVCSRFNLCYACGNDSHMLPCPPDTAPEHHL